MEVHTYKPFVYRWIHLPTGKWYIGSRTALDCHPDDGYLTSSKLVKKLIQANPEEWQREILYVGTREEILNLEVTLLKEFDAKNDPLSYNQHNGDGKFTRSGLETPLETRLKISESVKKNHPNRGKASPNRGRTASEETRKKQSQAKLGKKRKPFTNETRDKIRQAKLGKNNPSYGKTPSDDTKKKLSDSVRESWFRPTLKCPFCGKEGKVNMTRFHFDNCKYKNERQCNESRLD